jgi:hypothetical protein
MRILGTLLVSALAIALGASSAPCQSLAEAAAKEKERRKTVKPTKTITEAELHGGTAASVPAAPAAETDAKAADAKPTDGSSPKPGASPKEKTEEEIRADQIKNWKAKVDQTQAEIDRIQADIDKTQAALGDLSGPVYGGTRAAQMSRLETAQKSLAAAKQMMEDLQEEGRRNRY